jgi:uroporphyrin-III C-methyltransferase/precorrin-2 dehydrogenase/sirohydrochlorin ferrochelatase
MSRHRENVPGSDEAGGPRHMALGINMAGLRCLVVGGGRIGSRKASTLAAAGADVTVIAPVISKELQELVAAGRVRWQRAEYASAILDGFALVVAATDDRPLNLRIASDAEGRGILSCNVSAASRSRVIFPAVYTDEEITVAVHSHGRRCRLSQQVRDEIAQWLLENKPARNRQDPP